MLLRRAETDVPEGNRTGLSARVFDIMCGRFVGSVRSLVHVVVIGRKYFEVFPFKVDCHELQVSKKVSKRVLFKNNIGHLVSVRSPLLRPLAQPSSLALTNAVFPS